MSRVEIATQGWGWVADDAGNGLSNLDVQIKNLDGSAATHWDAVSGGTSSTGSITTLSDGSIPRFIESGTYTVSVAGSTHRVDAVATSDVAVVREAPLNIKDSRCGGVGGGANHDAALAQAKALLPPQGGDIFFPPDTYVFSDARPNFDNTSNVRLLGVGGRFGGTHANMTRLEYNGTGTFLSARSSYGFSLEGLYIYVPNLGASGIAVNLDKTTNDTVLGGIERCWLRGTNNGSGLLVSLAGAWGFNIAHNYFWGAGRAIRGRQVGGIADFSNSISVIHNTFEYSAAHPIFNPFQSWKIENNIFEPIQSVPGPAGAIECQSGFAVQGIVIQGNSFQDANTNGTWIKDLRGNGAQITGNFFYSGDKHITFAGELDGYFVLDTLPFSGAQVQGNLFAAANTACIDAGTDGVINFDEGGNFWHVDLAGGKKEIIGKVNADLGGGGVYLNGDGHSTATAGAAWPLANRALFVRYVPRVTHTAAGIAFHCTTADAGSPNGDVAILDANRNRLASSGAVSMVAATGIRYVPFTTPIVLRKGVAYYVGMGLVSATAVVLFMASFSTGTTAELISSATPGVLQGFRDAAVPIGNPVGALSSVGSIPTMAVRTT